MIILYLYEICIISCLKCGTPLLKWDKSMCILNNTIWITLWAWKISNTKNIKSYYSNTRRFFEKNKAKGRMVLKELGNLTQ